SSRAGSPRPVVDALGVVVVLATALGGAALKSSPNLFGASPPSYAVVVFWVVGVWLVNRGRRHPAWKVEAPGSTPGRRHRRQPMPGRQHPYTGSTHAAALPIFLPGAGLQLAARVGLR